MEVGRLLFNRIGHNLGLLGEITTAIKMLPLQLTRNIHIDTAALHVKIASVQQLS